MLKNIAKDVGLELTSDFLEKMELFKSLLFEFNSKHNITRLDSKMLDKYIVESIYPLSKIGEFENFLDVGSGNGIPAVPIALFTGKNGYLVESKSKKCAFLNYIKISMKIENINILNKRVEDVEIKPSLITSRAVDSNIFMKITSNLRNKDTKIIIYKGKNKDKEIEALKLIDEKNMIFLVKS